MIITAQQQKTSHSPNCKPFQTRIVRFFRFFAVVTAFSLIGGLSHLHAANVIECNLPDASDGVGDASPTDIDDICSRKTQQGSVGEVSGQYMSKGYLGVSDLARDYRKYLDREEVTIVDNTLAAIEEARCEILFNSSINLELFNDGQWDGHFVLICPSVEFPSVRLSVSALTVDEGSSNSYTVELTGDPDGPVTVTPSSDNPDVTISPSSLGFNSNSWNVAQSVTVTAIQDGDTADDVATISHAVSGLGDVTDGGTVSVTVEDDDRQIKLSVSSLTVDEGGNNSYTVELTSDPDGPVTVTPSSDNPDVTISPSSLGFNSDSWNVAQSVTVTAIQDGDTADDEATISHAVSGLGDVTDGGTVSVTVEDDEPAVTVDSVEEQEITAVTGALATVTSAAVSNVTTNIGARFSAARGGTNFSVAGQSLAQSRYAGKAGWSSLWDKQGYSRTLGSEDLLRSTVFQIALGAAEGEQGEAATQWSVWGRGDLQYFSSNPDRGSSYDGDLRAGYLGLDVQIDERWLAGIALSQTIASADYTLNGNSADGQGKMDVTLTSLLPYIRFAPDRQSELWAILGAGGGEIENIRPGATSSASETSDLSLWMASAGGRQALVSEGPLGWALLGDMSFGRVETEDGVQAVSGLTVDTWRTRLGVEGSFTKELESGGSFTAFVEVAGRLDGSSDDDEEAGVELSPGLFFSDPDSGFGVEVRGRALVLHSAENYEEYGTSATVSLSPRSDALGLSLSLTPRWGNGTGGTETLWHNDAFGQLTSRSDDRHAMSLDTRVGYGVQTMNGVLTPFGEFGLRDGDSRTARVGTSFGRYRSDPGALNLELSGEWRERASRDLEQRVQIAGQVRF